MVQPSEKVHSPSPDCVSDGPTGGRVMATGAENGAREVGMVAGSCGARYPAWPRVWMGQGLEPASNMNGGEVRAREVELMHFAVGESVAQQGEGGDLPAEVAAGRDSLRRWWEPSAGAG